MSVASIINPITGKIQQEYLPDLSTSDAISPFDVVDSTNAFNKLTTIITPQGSLANNFQTVYQTPTTDFANIQYYNPGGNKFITMDIINGNQGVSIGANQSVFAGNIAGYIRPYNISPSTGFPIIAQVCPYYTNFNYEPGANTSLNSDSIGSMMMVDMGNAQGLGTQALAIDGYLTDAVLPIGSAFWIMIPDPTNNTNLEITWKGNVIFTINAGDTKQYFFMKYKRKPGFPVEFDFARIERA